MSRWIKVMTTGGSLRGVSIQATALVGEMAKMHQIQGPAAQMLGESVLSALLLASSSKVGEKLNLNIRGSGHIFQALVDARPEGWVRGYVVQNSDFDTIFSDHPVGPWGEGLMSVLRTKLDVSSEPYIGTVPLLTGHLAKDVTFYLVQSEQVPSAVALQVKVQGDEVVSAMGVLVQALPGAQTDEIKRVESRIQTLGGYLATLDASTDPMQLMSQVFQDETFMKLEERELSFHCDCSIDRVVRSLVLVGKEELKTILDTQGQAMIKCDFCSKEYTVGKEKLQELIHAQ